MKRKYFLLGLLGLLVLIQFVRPDRSVPSTDPAADFCAVMNPPAPVADLMKAVCYDCHSYQTKYPWYGELAPVSLWLQHNVNEGREQINFSTFGAISSHDQPEVLEECSEEVLDGGMPLKSYTWVHAEARLSPEQRRMLADWFSRTRMLLEKSAAEEEN